MTARSRRDRIAAVPPSRVPAACRVAGCGARVAGDAGLCAAHAVEQEERRRAAGAPSGLAEVHVAIEHDPSWRGSAACRGCGPALFFPELGESAEEAKAICAGCTVASECRAFAVRNSERYGVWGGTTPRSRRPLRSGVRRQAS